MRLGGLLLTCLGDTRRAFLLLSPLFFLPLRGEGGQRRRAPRAREGTPVGRERARRGVEKERGRAGRRERELENESRARSSVRGGAERRCNDATMLPVCVFPQVHARALRSMGRFLASMARRLEEGTDCGRETVARRLRALPLSLPPPSSFFSLLSSPFAPSPPPVLPLSTCPPPRPIRSLSGRPLGRMGLSAVEWCIPCI